MMIRVASWTHCDVDFVFCAKEGGQERVDQSCGAECVELLEVAVSKSVVDLKVWVNCAFFDQVVRHVLVLPESCGSVVF